MLPMQVCSPRFLQWYPFHRQLIYNCCFIPSFQKVNCDVRWLYWCTTHQGHTDNHIKFRDASVDRIPKITESLYHSTIRLRGSKGLDYWWIYCRLPNGHGMPTGLLYFMWMMNLTLGVLQCRADGHIISWFYGDEPEQISKEPATIGPRGISKYLRSGTGQVSSQLNT